MRHTLAVVGARIGVVWRRTPNWALSLFAVALAAGHIAFWYLPRQRPKAPDPRDLPGEIILGTTYPLAIWLPYPHQNLGALGRGVKDPHKLLAAVARLADVPPPRLPGFGPFAVPPARELALGYDPQGSTVLAARIYPGLAVVARLAGWLASNPWLEGGEVPLGEESAQVTWRGSLWILHSGTVDRESLPAVQGVTPPEACLGMLRLADAPGPLAPGTYRVARHGSGLRLTRWEPSGANRDLAPGSSTPASGLRRYLAALERADIAVVALSGPQGPWAETPGALVLLQPARDTVARLPTAAVVYPTGGNRMSLPAESWVSALGLRLYDAQEGDWSVLALDSNSLETARVLARSLAPLQDPTSPEARTWSLWLDPAGTLAFATAMRRVVERIPLLSTASVERWRDVETVLEPLAERKEIYLEATLEPARLELYLGSN